MELLSAFTDVPVAVLAAEQDRVGVRGVLTVLGTLAFVGLCFAAVELLDRRGLAAGRAHADGGGPSVRAGVVEQRPVDDVWPLRERRPTRSKVAADRALAAAVGGSLAALGVALALIPLRSDIGLSSIALALVLVIVGAAAVGGRVAAAVTSAVAALTFNFLHTAPLYTFHIAATRNVVTSVLMILVGVAVGEVAVRTVRKDPTNHHNTPTEELP